MTVSGMEGGPAAAQLASELRHDIEEGQLAPGDFLPSVRSLKEQKHLAHQTVYNALRVLVSDGFVSAEPGRGYRVMARANDPTRGCPVACLFSSMLAGKSLSSFYAKLRDELQSAARRQGWSLMTAGARGMRAEQAIEECSAARSWAIVIDAHAPEIVERARQAGLTVIMVDSWHPDAGVDAVVQDGFGGGMRAARYLAGKGHQRIAWFGAATGTVHGQSRYGGAVSGLLDAGLAFPSDMVINVDETPSADAARKLLAREDRPTAVLALQPSKCAEIANAAVELGLSPGKDLEIVGWCASEYEQEFLAALPPGFVPPRISWSMRTLADTAIERLAQRRTNPGLAAMRINIETSLRAPATSKESA
jgi:DNA-binding LacI/PurR family transcriptional regulator